MTKIKNTEAYPIKKYPVPADYVIGSDSEDNGKTVNFNLETIINMVDGLIDYQYSLSSLPITTPNGDGFFQSQGITDFSAITKFQISKITLGGQNLDVFYNYLITNFTEYSIFLVSKTNRSIFAYYKIAAVAEIDDYYEFTVMLSSANSYLGQLEDKEIYSFEYNKVDDNNPLTVITQTITDGDTTHAPSGDAVFDALAAIEAQIPDVFTKIVYFNSTNPATATIFDIENPPVTNDNALKNNVNYLYIGTDASTWVYKTSPAGYVTYIVTSGASNFYITGTSIDAGGIKTGSITKRGEMVIDSQTALVSGFKIAQNPGTSALGTFSILTRNNTTGLIEKTLDSNYIHSSGNELSLTGLKQWTNTGATTVNAILLVNNGTVGTSSLGVDSNSSGIAVKVSNNSTGNGIYGDNTSSGNFMVVNGSPSSTGFSYVGQNNGANTFTVTKAGDINANSFIKTGGTASQFLKANGSVDSNIYALDSEVVHRTSLETIRGLKLFQNPTSVDQAGISMSYAAAGPNGLSLTTLNNSSANTGVIFENRGTTNSSAFLVELGSSNANAEGISINTRPTAVPDTYPIRIFQGANHANTKFSVRDTGDTTANSFIKIGGTAAQFLKADGSVDSNAYAIDLNVLHKTGNETFDGIKSSTNNASTPTSGIELTNNGSVPSYVLRLTNTSTGTGFLFDNIGAGLGFSLNNSGSGVGFRIINSTTGIGQTVTNNSTGLGLQNTNIASGVLASYNSQTGSTGDLMQFQKNSVLTSKIDQNGRYSIVGGTSSQFLMADGSVNSAIFSDNSAGAIEGFAVTNNGNGTVNIATGTAYLRATNDPYAQLVKYTIPAVTNLALTDNANNFILVDYNGGSPALTVTTNTATINTETNSLAIVISRVGTTLDYLSLVGQNVDANAKLRVRFLNQEGIRRANGAGLGFSARNLTLTAGVLFSGLIRINSPAFNTASPDTFTQVYNNGAVWTRTTGQTQVNNTQYNNGGVLTNLGNNDYRTDYIYLLPNNPSKLYLVLGTASYASLTAARTAPVPSLLPSELQNLGLLVGRIIIQRLGVNITESSSAFDVVFADSSVPNHNDLAGIQGGAVGDYQHLTTAEKALVTGSVQGSGVSGQVAYWTGTKLQAGSSKFLYNEPTNVLTLNASSGFFDVAKTVNGTTASPSFENILRYGSANSYSFIQGGNSNTTDFGTYLNFVINSSASNSPINAMTILPSGNLGIRTLTPNFNLHLNSPANSTYFQITSALSGTTNVDGLLIGMANNNDAQFINRENSSIQFHTNNTEKLRIQGDGNVVIGATSANGRLEVASTGNNVSFTGLPSGSIVIGNNHPSNALPAIVGKSANSVGLQLNTMTADSLISGDMQFVTRELGNTDFTTLTNSAFRFTRFSTSLIDILRNGNVGFGISAPNYPLHIHHATPYIQLTTPTTGTTTNDGFVMGVNASSDVQLINRENTSLQIWTNNTEKLRVFGSGGVSIGNTTDPGAGVINVGQLKINAMNTAPATATSAGVVGEIRVTAGFIYVCSATNTWVRAALATF